jgi:hypothetical protein
VHVDETDIFVESHFVGHRHWAQMKNKVKGTVAQRAMRLLPMIQIQISDCKMHPIKMFITAEIASCLTLVATVELAVLLNIELWYNQIAAVYNNYWVSKKGRWDGMYANQLILVLLSYYYSTTILPIHSHATNQGRSSWSFIDFQKKEYDKEK